jgi:hypothetical protein
MTASITAVVSKPDITVFRHPAVQQTRRTQRICCGRRPVGFADDPEVFHIADKRKPKPRKRSGGQKRSGQGRGGQGSQPRGQGRKKKHYSATTRDKAAPRSSNEGKRRRDLKGAAVDLPNWVVEGLVRVTPKERVAAALEALGEASAAMADSRYHAAVKYAKTAKNLSPQDATIREVLGLSAYRIGDWDTALSELRAYRRMAGEAVHLPIEMDVLRAMNRDRDVEKAWDTLEKADVPPSVWKEGKVVYGSHLLEKGDAAAAWDLTGPERVGPNAHEADLRVWYVAARAAAHTGETATARRIADAIVLNDPSFPGLDALEGEIARSS